jgi:hypothetical protein
MSVSRPNGVVVREGAEQKLGEQSAKRAVLVVVLAVLVSPSSEVMGCENVPSR